MKKLSKSIVALLIVSLCLALAACGTTSFQGGASASPTASASDSALSPDSATASPSASAPAVPTQKYTVGVVIYDPTDLMQQAVNKYFNGYITPNFNVEFMFSDAIKDSDGEISFLENCASKGATGIIGNYSVTDQKVLLDKCKELGLYYIAGLSWSDEQMAEAKDNQYFVGCVGNGSGVKDAAYDMAMYFFDNGARKLGMATGGVDMGVQQFIDIYDGVQTAIKDFETKNAGQKIDFTSFDGFPNNDAFFASQAKMIASKPDAIIAFAGEFLWVQPLTDAGMAGKIKLGTISSMNDVSFSAVSGGAMSYLSAQMPEGIGVPFAALYNAMTGYPMRDNGNPIRVMQPIIPITSKGDVDKWTVLLNNDVPPYSVDDLKSVINVFSPNATFADLDKLAKAADYDSITARRGIK